MKCKCDVCGSQIISNKIVGSQFWNTDYFSKENVDIGQVLNLNKLDAMVGEPVLTNPNTVLSISKVSGELLQDHLQSLRRANIFASPPECQGSYYQQVENLSDGDTLAVSLLVNPKHEPMK